MKTTKLACFCLLATMLSWIASATTATASPALETHVPDGFDLTVRVDVAQALDAPELEPLRQQFLNGGVYDVIDHIYVLSGIDLLEDLQEVVLAGYFDDAREADGLVLLRGRWDPNSVLSIFETAAQYQEIPLVYGVLYTFWSDDDQEMRYAAFPAPDVVALGRRRPVEKVLMLNDPTAARMIDNPAYNGRLRSVDPNAVCRLIATTPPTPGDDKVAIALQQSLRAFGGSLRLNDGIELAAAVELVDPNAVHLWRELAEGAVALIQMVDRSPEVATLARRLAITSGGSALSASLSMSMEEAWDLLAKQPKFRMLKTATP